MIYYLNVYLLLFCAEFDKLYSTSMMLVNKTQTISPCTTGVHLFPFMPNIVKPKCAPGNEIKGFAFIEALSTHKRAATL